MTYTDLEKLVYNHLIACIALGGVLDTNDISLDLDLSKETVKGVLGSLTKKGLVDCDDGSDSSGIPVVWPIHENGEVGFLCDTMTRAEVLASKI